jgi:peptidoglycan glycosyltransferase
VNASISRVFLVVVVLFAVLVGFTSRWTVFEADALRDNPKNARPLLESLKIPRGTIRAADGTVLARSVRTGPDGLFSRRYPSGDLFGHAVGYSYARLGQIALERFRQDELTGRDSELGSFVDELVGRRPVGKTVTTHLDPDAQRTALQALGGRKGAVVAIEPSTGAVQALVSVPTYDPNALRRTGELERLNRDTDAPLFDRATQAGYPPGSTFKVVTAIAAMDSGRFRPESLVDGRNGKPISGVPLNNFGGEQFGRITLTDALTNSVNTAWASVGESLGGATMQRYMSRLGFGADVPIDLPEADVRASGERVDGELVEATDDAVDVGRMAIGQDKLTVTPLQMAQVAAAVANGGELMKPRITAEVSDRDGRRTDAVEPERESRVMSAQAAAEVKAMMARVVEEGTGTAAALSGIPVAGKTGTAEGSGGCRQNQAWFIGFAPLDDPKVAVAATVECTPGTGGVDAAPIAKAVMESLLR